MESASHVFYRCQYHIVWTPKYRFKILTGNLGKELYRSIYVYCSMKKCKVVELNVQIDHVHLVVSTPPNVSVSELMGVLKGRTAIRTVQQIPASEKEKAVGKSLLATRVFCRFRGSERRNNQTICETSRQGSSGRRRAANDVGYGVTLN